MIINNFFKGRGIVFLILLVGLFGFYLVKNYFFNEQSVPNLETEEVFETEEVEIVPVGEPTFTWVFDYIEDQDFPTTIVKLEARYENGVVVSKEVDTAQGSCNEYPGDRQGVYAKSELAMCYFAGFGHHYKIIKSNDKYLVQRKIFEEASPDYNPPVLPFETIAEF